jgi:hypothetical protein
MIEDSLWITIRVIEEHQKNCPEIYGHMKTDLDVLKEQMREVLKELDPKCVANL